LATYLADEQIEATFFMCGKHVSEHPDVPSAVLALGHRVGNHTWSHRHLPELDDQAIRDELRSTRALLGECGVEGEIPFRPPWGEWDGRIDGAVRSDPEVLATHSANYGWDIDGMDWQFWWDMGSAKDCADSYLSQIRRQGRGVVLMHDSTADPGRPGEEMRAGNLAVDMVKLLIPMLRAEGFTFVPLAAVDI
jgi:peptidoglycan/xylan/chitin deacetylase (PgdA/CDA1 family)